MNHHDFLFRGARLQARASGALFWPSRGMLVVSDLHLGKSERIARRGGAILPPYEAHDTLARLEAEIEATGASRILCLGDSFDDAQAARALEDGARRWAERLCRQCDWIWVEGNHDPGAPDFVGRHCRQHDEDAITFRHIASKDAAGEVSGHYHPKARISARGMSVSRPCFLIDAARIVLPAFGTYTGGLQATAPVLQALMGPDAIAVLTGRRALTTPMPRCEPTEAQQG